MKAIPSQCPCCGVFNGTVDIHYHGGLLYQCSFCSCWFEYNGKRYEIKRIITKMKSLNGKRADGLYTIPTIEEICASYDGLYDSVLDLYIFKHPSIIKDLLDKLKDYYPEKRFFLKDNFMGESEFFYNNINAAKEKYDL